MKIISTLILLVTSSYVYSQAWKPLGRDESFPRTLFDKSEITNIRLHLSEDNFRAIYQHIFQGDVYNAFSLPGNRALEFKAPDQTEYKMVAPRAIAAKNAAFVLLMNRDVTGVNPLSVNTRIALTNRVLNYLRLIETDGDNYEGNPLLGGMFNLAIS